MNLPNKLTLVRIFLVPVFLVLLLNNIPYGDLFAALIFIIAASTDGLDGYIARSRKQITTLGKFMDPLADKLLISAALIALVDLGRISSWIAIIIICREFAVTGLRTIAAAENVIIAASKLGKLKTVTQILAISIILLQDFAFLHTIIPQSFLALIGQITLYIALFFTVYSGVDYMIKCKDFLFPKNPQNSKTQKNLQK